MAMTETTTNATVHRDLERSFRERTQARVEELLGQIGHPEDDAHAYASVIPRLMDPAFLEAHVMLVADRLFPQAHPWATRRLIGEPHKTRCRYIRRAMEIVTLLRGALEGQRDPDVTQAAADYVCHRESVLRAMRLVKGGRDGRIS